MRARNIYTKYYAIGIKNNKKIYIYCPLYLTLLKFFV